MALIDFYLIGILFACIPVGYSISADGEIGASTKPSVVIMMLLFSWVIFFGFIGELIYKYMKLKENE